MIGKERTGKLVLETGHGILDWQTETLDFSWKKNFNKGVVWV